MKTMFKDTYFPKFKVLENNTTIGELEVNQDFIKQNTFYQPMIREKETKEVLKVGTRDNEVIQKFIIASMNDYYNRLLNSNGNERNIMLTNYNRLYDLWKELFNYKRTNNITEINKTYDMFTYGLYLIGYEM